MSLLTNIVAYWKLDESSGNAADSVGSNTLSNNGTATYASAVINNGVDLGTSNTTKWMSIASNLGITGGNITIAGWVKLRTEVPADTNYDLFSQCNATNNVGYLIRYADAGGIKTIAFDRVKLDVVDDFFSETITLGTSNFYHIGLTYDSSTQDVIAYINGSSVGTAPGATGNGASSGEDHFVVGATDLLAPNKTSGIFDEIGVWSRALTGTEFSQLYNGGSGFQYPFTTPAVSNAGFFMNFI